MFAAFIKGKFDKDIGIFIQHSKDIEYKNLWNATYQYQMEQRSTPEIHKSFIFVTTLLLYHANVKILQIRDLLTKSIHVVQILTHLGPKTPQFGGLTKSNMP